MAQQHQQEKVVPIQETSEQCDTVSTLSIEGVELAFTRASIRTCIASGEGLSFRLLGNSYGEVVCRVAVISTGTSFISDYLASIRGVDVRSASPHEIASMLQQTYADPSAWPLALEFDRERARVGIASKSSDVRDTNSARIAQAVNATEFESTKMENKMRMGHSTAQAKPSLPQGFVGPQLIVTPRLTILAAIGAPLSVVAICGYMLFFGLTLRTYNAQETTDADVADFINGWTNVLGIAITGIDSGVQYLALSGLTAVFVRALQCGPWCKLFVSICVVTSISSALSGLSIQRKPSRILPAMVEADFQKYLRDDYAVRTDWFVNKYDQLGQHNTATVDVSLR